MEACSAAELLRGSADDDRQEDDELHELEVLSENWQAVEVFRCCQPTYAGMAGACVGIAGTEIRAVSALLRVPRSTWPEVAHKVHYMGQLLASMQAEQRKSRPAR